MNFSINTNGIFGEAKETIIANMKSDRKGTPIPIGGKEYTLSEWEKFLLTFDKAQESVQEVTEDHKIKSLEQLIEAYEANAISGL